jgi:hypothetical protein
VRALAGRLDPQPRFGSESELQSIDCPRVFVGRDVRDPLRDALRLELSSGAEDLDAGLTANNTDATTGARTRIEDAARLLDDLGWSDEDTRKRFRITMPVDRLVALLERLDQTTMRALHDYAWMLRGGAWVQETAQERRDRLEAIREFADMDLDTRNAAFKLRAALDNTPA